MSDFNFYGANTPASSNTGACTFSGSTITTTNTIAAAGDVVYFQISGISGAVGVAQDNPREFKVDTNIYSNIASSFTPDNAYKFDVPNDLLHSNIASYRIETAVEIGTYSESYKPYKTSLDFKLVTDNRRREFFGDVKELITTTYIVFKDGCEDLAYLVSFSEDAFLTLNNKFKSSLEFNIATR